MSDVIAILASDLHLSLTPPVARSAEPDWLAAQKRQLDEVMGLFSRHEDAILVIAGDVFDRWNAPAEIVNMVIEEFQGFGHERIYAIPGQHDLPNHRLDEVRRSAYWTLVAAGCVQPIQESTRVDDGLVLWGFPWGVPVHPPTIERSGFNLAVVHRYVWLNKNTCYPGAPEESQLNAFYTGLHGYDAAVFGDNHIGWASWTGTCRVMNCGTFFRRKSDERHYRPQVGLLYADGTIAPHYLDVSKDLWLEEPLAKAAEQILDTSSFLQSLKELGSDSLDYRELVRRHLADQNVKEEVATLVLQSMGS